VARTQTVDNRVSLTCVNETKVQKPEVLASQKDEDARSNRSNQTDARGDGSKASGQRKSPEPTQQGVILDLARRSEAARKRGDEKAFIQETLALEDELNRARYALKLAGGAQD